MWVAGRVKGLRRAMCTGCEICKVVGKVGDVWGGAERESAARELCGR